MKIVLMFVIEILLIINFGCSKNEIEIELENIKYEKVAFPDSGKVRFQSYFKPIKKIKFNTYKDDSLKLLEFTKVVELNNGELLVLDRFATSIFLINTTGKIKNRFGRKGQGPGEFRLIADFCVNDKGEIFVLDVNNKVNKFSSKFKYLKTYNLSFSLRAPERIMYIGNNKFLITAYQNLIEGSTKTNYKYLEYDQVNYLHLYDAQFKKIKSFRKLSKELEHTKGRLARSIGQFVSNSIWEGKVISVSQEGMYRMKIYDNESKLIKIIDIKSKYFKSINLYKIKNMRFINNRWNLSRKEIGEIIADHSTIKEINKIGKYFIITIYEPYDNFYPQYRSRHYPDKFYYDIFYLENMTIKPVVSNIEGKYKLIGVGKNNTVYFTNKDINDSGIYIYKYKLKL